MAMLAEVVELVVGVDTHKHTHTAAVVQAVSGAVVEQVTVPATPPATSSCSGWLANTRPAGVAIERTGGYGADLTRFLPAHAEPVWSGTGPSGQLRCHGATSDPWMRSGRLVRR